MRYRMKHGHLVRKGSGRCGSHYAVLVGVTADHSVLLDIAPNFHSVYTFLVGRESRRHASGYSLLIVQLLPLYINQRSGICVLVTLGICQIDGVLVRIMHQRGVCLNGVCW